MATHMNVAGASLLQWCCLSKQQVREKKNLAIFGLQVTDFLFENNYNYLVSQLTVHDYNCNYLEFVIATNYPCSTHWYCLHIETYGKL